MSTRTSPHVTRRGPRVLWVLRVLRALAAIGTVLMVVEVTVASSISGERVTSEIWPEPWNWSLLWVFPWALPALIGLTALARASFDRTGEVSWRSAFLPALAVPVLVMFAATAAFWLGLLTGAALPAWVAPVWIVTAAVLLRLDAGVKGPDRGWLLPTVCVADLVVVSVALGVSRHETVGVAAVVTGALGLAALARSRRTRSKLRVPPPAAGLIAAGVMASGGWLVLDDWALSHPVEVLRESPYELEAIAVSADGRYLASVTTLGYVRIADLSTGRDQGRELDPGTASVRFSADSRRLHAATYHGNAFTLDLRTGRWSDASGIGAGDGLPAQAADGTFAFKPIGLPVTIHPPGPSSPARPQSYPTLGEHVRSLAISADAGVLAIGYEDGDVKVTDTVRDVVLLDLPSPVRAPTNSYSSDVAPRALALSDGRGLLAIGTADGRVRVIDVTSGQSVTTLRQSPVTGSATPIEALAFTRDEGHLLVADDGGRISRWVVPSS